MMYWGTVSGETAFGSDPAYVVKLTRSRKSDSLVLVGDVWMKVSDECKVH